MGIIDKLSMKGHKIVQVAVSNTVNLFFEILANTQKKQKITTPINNLSKTKPQFSPDCSSIWIENQSAFYKDCKTRNLKKFLQWKIIQQTMFFNDSKICNIEYNYLKKSTIWKNVWKTKLEDPFLGYPIRYLRKIKTSINSIHHAYHLEKFLQFLSFSSINEFDLIFEFGGGYGNLCRILYNIGYVNEYWIFDLPQFTILQKYYLTNTLKKNINQISFFSQIDELLGKKMELCEKKILFIATWSISESPINIRNNIADLILPGYYLIAYQNKFNNIDNENYFSSFVRKNSLNTIWKIEKIDHLPDSNYLFGKPFYE